MSIRKQLLNMWCIISDLKFGLKNNIRVHVLRSWDQNLIQCNLCKIYTLLWKEIMTILKILFANRVIEFSLCNFVHFYLSITGTSPWFSVHVVKVLYDVCWLQLNIESVLLIYFNFSHIWIRKEKFTEHI